MLQFYITDVVIRILRLQRLHMALITQYNVFYSSGMPAYIKLLLEL